MKSMAEALNEVRGQSLNETPQGFALVSKAKDLAKKFANNMSKAVKEIEKLEKGLSKNPTVDAELRKYNEDYNKVDEKISDIFKANKEGESISDIAKRLKLSPSMVKKIMGEDKEELDEKEVIKASLKDEISALKKKLENEKNEVAKLEPNKEETIIETDIDADNVKKDDSEKEKELKIKLDKEKDQDALEKQLIAAQGQINILKAKLENEKNRAIKPEPNPDTGEVPLTIGIAHQEFKKQRDKEKKQEVKEGGPGSGPQGGETRGTYSTGHKKSVMKPGAGKRPGSAKDGGQTDKEADDYDNEMGESLGKEDEPKVKKIIKKLKGASDAHAGQAKDLEKAMKNENLDKPIVKETKILSELDKAERDKRLQRAKDMIKFYNAQKKAALKGPNKALAKKMLKNDVKEVSDKLKLKVLKKKIQQYKDKVFKKTMSTIKSPLFADKEINEVLQINEFTSKMIADLKKSFSTAPKRISPEQANKLSKHLDRIQLNDLRKLVKANIPFVSTVARNKIYKKTGKFEETNVEDKRLYVEAISGLQKKADKSGMPYSILKKVYDRGMAAWKSGHRPGASQQQWAFARVNSFITKSSGTWGGADKDLAAKVKGSK